MIIHCHPTDGQGMPFRRRLLAMSLLFAVLPAHAFPPPPDPPPLLRMATMTATVTLVEAGRRQVSKITELCKVSGKIPVYADRGSGIASAVNAGEIAGCKMSSGGKTLHVSVRGAKAMLSKSVSYATAYIAVTPPDAVPLCSMCGPQPLADSSAQIRVSGTPRSMAFSLSPNPVSILNAKPTVWLEADVEIVD